jgi:hypothetical protein
MKKTIFQRLLIGFKKGYNTPTLPENLITLHNSVLIRYLRITGGLSTILLITGRLEKLVEKLGLNSYIKIFFYLCLILTILFFFYSIYLNFHRIKYMYKVWKSDELDVRNSPLDKLASIGSRLLWCAKGFCDAAAPATFAFGAMGGIDKLREMKGLQPIFLPFLADLLIPDSEHTKAYKVRQKDIQELHANDFKRKSYLEELTICKELRDRNIINETEHADWTKALKEQSSFLDQQNEDIKKKIKANLEANDPRK